MKDVKIVLEVLKVILVDDDIETINLFNQFQKENTVLFTITDVTSDTDELIGLINSNKPDLLIVSLDNISFNAKILNALNVRKPKIIFISKYKSNAYNAYRNDGLSFLMKPLDSNEIIISIYKVIKLIEMESVYQNDKIVKINTLNVLNQNSDYLAIAFVDRIELLKIDEIVICKADGKYTEFYLNNKTKILSSKNLGEYESLLNNNFFRIHHSYVVNIKYLIKIIKKDGLYCEFVNGQILPVAKRRQEEFIKFIKL